MGYGTPTMSNLLGIGVDDVIEWIGCQPERQALRQAINAEFGHRGLTGRQVSYLLWKASGRGLLHARRPEPQLMETPYGLMKVFPEKQAIWSTWDPRAPEYRFQGPRTEQGAPRRGWY
ncbi:hypothetical protein C9F11_08975 [Streptomyces sp. YIM 121038]|uniref:hypothetical protein n=1 Tax=Streptomyces sp. YIM 121038 TaxID=2136401 RepID=UPI00111004AE|nr:hypothetical protein [Streptomyces sp. YIM 121038]QCX75484.1 hypothetical protein C9F11_08975 [Streptomyces sp. YIM 121038]